MLALVAIGATSRQLSFADSETPSFVPDACADYVGQPSSDHFLKVIPLGDNLPGDSIRVEAGTTSAGTGSNAVRIVAAANGNVFHDNEWTLPNPYGQVTDEFGIPMSAPYNAKIDIYACFESPGSSQGQGVTQHLEGGSFFVLPESPVGIAALIGSSLAAFSGFVFLKSRKHASLPI